MTIDESAQTALAGRIHEFLRTAADPALEEAGEPPLKLTPGNYTVTLRQGRLFLEAFDDSRTLRRRLRGIRRARPGELLLETELFGGRAGELWLSDRARARGPTALGRPARLQLRERLRRFLSRQFTGWRIAILSSEADLEHSLSPAFPRALVRRNDRAWAALAAPADPAAADTALTFGLIWLDYVRRRERHALVEGLCLLAPPVAALNLSLRLRWLRRHATQFLVFTWEGDWEEPVDPAGPWNLDTRLEPAAATRPPALNPDRPEARLEALIRRAPSLIDAQLHPAPVYGQVPAWAARDRGVIDLLAAGHDGRLAVVELKATADPHLPLQALDYWLRVEWHLRQGDFTRLGYFPGIHLRPDPPRLLLVAPALQFHPSTEAILRHFDPRIDVERIGLADTRFVRPGLPQVEWQGELAVAFRIHGARPLC